jgi:membrane protease YdiL (CAAX protease family)
MLVFLGALGPALAAMIMSAVTGGSAAVWMLLRRMIQVRIGIQWYLFVLFVPLVAPLMIMLPFESGTLVLALVSVKGLLALGIYIVSAFLSIVLGSPIGEEPGWRGFALPRLQERYGPIWGSLVLGLLWACWHLPLFFTGWGKAYAIIGIALGFLLFALLVLGYTFVATWLFNNTRGSIFMAALFHAALNSRSVFFLVLFPEALNEMPDAATVLSSLLILAIAWLLVAGLLLVLTKGKLSYKGPDELVRSGACQKLADESSSLSA